MVRQSNPSLAIVITDGRDTHDRRHTCLSSTRSCSSEVDLWVRTPCLPRTGMPPDSRHEPLVLETNPSTPSLPTSLYRISFSGFPSSLSSCKDYLVCCVRFRSPTLSGTERTLAPAFRPAPYPFHNPGVRLSSWSCVTENGDPLSSEPSYDV